MFADPRSGGDRRKKSPKGVAREDEQRASRDRRMHHGEVKEWWLARRYVTAEIITGIR